MVSFTDYIQKRISTPALLQRYSLRCTSHTKIHRRQLALCKFATSRQLHKFFFQLFLAMTFKSQLSFGISCHFCFLVSREVPVGGRVLLTKIKMAFSGSSLIRFRITYTNWPTVKSAGTKYLLNIRTTELKANVTSSCQYQECRCLVLFH